MSRTLDAAQRIAKLEEMVEKGELSVEDIADTMEGVEMEFTDKVDAICDLIERAKQNEEACATRVQQYQQRKKMWSNQSDSLRRFLLMCVDATKRTSVKTVYHTVSLKKTKDKIVISDLDKLPDEFKIPEVIVKADASAIEKAISAGDSVAGVSVEPGYTTIQIR